MATPVISNGVFVNSIPHSKEKDLPDGGNWVVQKFGGTSVGKFASNICDIIE
jgi:aspartate kinase